MDFLKANGSFTDNTEPEKESKTVNHEFNNGSKLSSLGIEHSYSYLTNREQEILYLISEGFRTVEIAKKLFISPQTVSTHRKHMIKKLHARTTPHLVGIAIHHGLI